MITHYWGLGGLSHCGRDVAMENGHAYTNTWDTIDCPECLVYKPHARKKEEPVLNNYYVTFGMMYRHEAHPYWPGAHPGGYLEVIAPDEEQARALVRSHIGLKWSHMYDRKPEWAERGRLATISEDGVLFPVEGVEPPTPQFGPSDCRYYGTDTNEVVGARIEGVLEEGSDYDALEKLGYEAALVHKRCLTEGLALFAKVYEVDSRVMAGELDYADPHNCPVCNTSIT